MMQFIHSFVSSPLRPLYWNSLVQLGIIHFHYLKLPKWLILTVIFSPGLWAIQLVGDILFGLLKKVAPCVHEHLKSQEIGLILYMTEGPSVLSIWDIGCYEEVKVFIQVSFMLFKKALPRKIRQKCPSNNIFQQTFVQRSYSFLSSQSMFTWIIHFEISLYKQSLGI